MLAHLNQILTLSPALHERRTLVRNPSSLSFKFQCFCSPRLSHYTETSRVSRTARTEAQEALFDYLHCTRNFSFNDAEHISKNSPAFVENLLSKVDAESDIARSLSRSFRYDPINEFEPFFESIGLKPSEVPLHLPKHLIFMSDDPTMLENFRALSAYGIPRCKIGAMYREAKQIFEFPFGEVTWKLQAYESLGLSRSTVIQLVTSCPLLLVGGVDLAFVEVLQKLNGLGIGNDWIGWYIPGNSTYNWKRMIDTIHFLEKAGYSEEEMSDLFKTNPSALLEGSGKRLYSMFGRLLKLSIGMNDVCLMFKQNPKMLSKTCSRNLFRAVDFLFEIGMPVEDTADIVAKHMEFLGFSALKGPKTVCKELKVRRHDLCRMMKKKPLKVLILASKSRANTAPSPNRSKHIEKAAFLVRLGYVENSDEMAKALKKFRGRGDRLQERFDCLVEAGLDYNVVTEITKHAPMILNQNRDVLEKKIRCLTNEFGYPLESLVAFPSYLSYDMERINLRFSMYAWLRKNSAPKPMLKLSTILACSEKRFVKYFVDVHPEGPAMWESLRSSFSLST